jgi:hypothetical protein
MAEKEEFRRYGHLIDCLWRFACGPWQLEEYKTEDEVKQALRWIALLERKQDEEEAFEQS